jgi:hypothetical protein
MKKFEICGSSVTVVWIEVGHTTRAVLNAVLKSPTLQSFALNKNSFPFLKSADIMCMEELARNQGKVLSSPQNFPVRCILFREGMIINFVAPTAIRTTAKIYEFHPKKEICG